MNNEHERHELLVRTLNSDEARTAYKVPYDRYFPHLTARLLGKLLVGAGNMVYGEAPTYLKFRAIEIIARVPYHSWASALFTLLTLHYADEVRALRLSQLSRFTEFAAENETMHVVVISKLALQKERPEFLRYTLFPVLFAFLYFWISYLLYMINARSSLEMNYVFEQHAYDQYQRFLDTHGEQLRHRPVESAFLAWYGRFPRSEFEFFESVRNDELVHRNRSLHELSLHENYGR